MNIVDLSVVLISDSRRCRNKKCFEAQRSTC